MASTNTFRKGHTKVVKTPKQPFKTKKVYIPGKLVKKPTKKK